MYWLKYMFLRMIQDNVFSNKCFVPKSWESAQTASDGHIVNRIFSYNVI